MGFDQPRARVMRLVPRCVRETSEVAGSDRAPRSGASRSRSGLAPTNVRRFGELAELITLNRVRVAAAASSACVPRYRLRGAGAAKRVSLVAVLRTSTIERDGIAAVHLDSPGRLLL